VTALIIMLTSDRLSKRVRLNCEHCQSVAKKRSNSFPRPFCRNSAWTRLTACWTALHLNLSPYFAHLVDVSSRHGLRSVFTNRPTVPTFCLARVIKQTFPVYVVSDIIPAP